MPNHVQNFLTISGEREDVDRCLDGIKGDEKAIDFNSISAYPQEFAELDIAAEQWDGSRPRPIDGFNAGGCSWCVENWGTKWNAYNQAGPAIEDGKCNSAHIIFQTAWSPPTPVIQKMASRFPELSFTLNSFEMGMQTCRELHIPCTEDDEKPVAWEAKYEGSRGG